MGRHPKPLTIKERNTIVKMASQGATKASILKEVGRAKNSFQKHKEMIEAYEEGLDKVRNKIAKESIESGDYRDRALLFERLGILTNPVLIEDIKSIDDAKLAMGKVLNAYAGGKLTASQFNNLTKGIERTAQLFFDADVVAELEALKEQLGTTDEVDENEFQ